MANNCSFEITVSAQRPEDAGRVLAILQDRDPEYAVIRGWPDDVHAVDGEGTGSLTIGGLCPWTADYMWDPEDTIYGHGLIPGETVLDDGRILVSIPLLCRLWGMHARGWELEEGCEVSGRYTCGPDGTLEYIEDWREYVAEMAALNPDDDYWNGLLEECEEAE